MPALREIRGDHNVTVPVTGMAAAGTDAEQVAFVAPFNCVITAVRWIPSAAITANGTNYTTVSVRNRGAAGTGSALPASRSYATGNSSAWVGENMTLSGTASDLSLSAGDVVTVQMIHSGTGIQLPAGSVRISYQAR